VARLLELSLSDGAIELCVYLIDLTCLHLQPREAVAAHVQLPCSKLTCIIM